MTVAGSDNYEVLRLSQKDIVGMNLQYLNIGAITITPGVTRDSEDQNNIQVDSLTTLDINLIGLNGFDEDVFTPANALVRVFAIGDSLGGNPSGYIASLNDVPLLPRGSVVDRPYDQYRRIGWFRMDSGGSTILLFKQTGNRNIRQYFFDTMIQVLNNGTATSLTAIDLSLACPPIDNLSWFAHVEFTPAAAGNTVKFTPFGSTATVIPGISGVVAAVKQTEQIRLLATLNSGAPKTLYINSAASCDTDIWCSGFEDILN